MRRFVPGLLTLALLVVSVGVGVDAQVADPASKPATRAEHLARLPAEAGPALLRAEPSSAPQLENVAPFEADPILVSGATAYRGGEFMYQDYLFDDHGAAAPGGAITPKHRAHTGVSGTISYPTDAEMFAFNAADLVEFRVKALPDATAFRVTLNTMALDPDRTAFTIALGSSPEPVPYPFGANVRGPASMFLTVHGTTGVLTDASGSVLATLPASADTHRYQYTVAVPRSAWDPGDESVRLSIGVGLWDPPNGRYHVPQMQADESRPGGAGTLTAAAAFFNVGFRDEPQSGGYGTVDAVISTSGPGESGNLWRENAQSAGLAAGDMSGFSADVDFGKLRAGQDDDSDVPTTGVISRIFASHFTLCALQPTDEPSDPDSPSDPTDISLTETLAALGHRPCPPRQRGRGFDSEAIALKLLGELQPYTIQVPEYQGKPYGLALMVHGGGANYNEHVGTAHANATIRRGSGAIALTAEQRGPSGESRGPAMADLFEAWNDVARWYPLDPTWTTGTGISQGGHGLYRLTATWPDLVARIFPIVSSLDDDKIRSFRNVEVWAWNGLADELVRVPEVQGTVDRFIEAGYRIRADQFSGDHVMVAAFDGVQPVIDWLGEHRAPANPGRVTYVLDPEEALPDVGVDTGHLYWIEGMTARGDGRAFVDATRGNSGHGEPSPSGRQVTAGAATGQTVPALGYVRQFQTWSEPEAEPPAATLELTLTNISSVTIDMTEAGLPCDTYVEVATDGDTDVILEGCDRVVKGEPDAP